MRIETVEVGPIQTNCYIVEDAGEVLVIDPGDEVERIMEALAGRAVKLIVATHRHWDHVSALAALQDACSSPVAMSKRDATWVDGQVVSDGHDISRGYPPASVGVLLVEDDEVEVGSATFRVIETPGHTPGSICLYCERDGVLFAGDTLFAGGSFGRTDFVDGDFDAIVSSMQNKLSKLPDETAIYSGHGPSSHMGRERALNQYL